MKINYPLGKRPAVVDPRTLKLSKYLAEVPAPPLDAGYIDKVIGGYPMYGNDLLGTCVEAAMGHEQQRWTAYSGMPVTPKLSDIIGAYSDITGYRPGDPSSDNGTDPLQALKYWRRHGLAGHKIVAYASVDPKNHVEVKQALWLFGAVFTGLQLPIAAQNPILGSNGLPCWARPRSLASVEGMPGGWGGHMVDLAGYGVDKNGNSGSMIVTWGQLYDMTWGFIDWYCDEMWAIVTNDWLDANGQSPTGLNISALLADLRVIAG